MTFEKWLYTVPLRTRSLFKRSQVEQELEEEMQFHLEQRIEQGIAQGLTREEARYEAMRAMQGFEQNKESCRDERRVNFLENLGRDLHYAVRLLRKSPAFTTVAVLSLALGIGANAAIFSLIDTLLLRPLPVAQPEQLRSLFLSTGPTGAQYYLTYPIFDSLRSRNSIFAEVFAWANHEFQMRSGAEMAHVDGALVSGEYFSALGITPILGRTFTAADDHPAGGKDGPVAVISYRFWTSQFQRSPSVIGSGITLDKVRFTIIGVMPPQFFGTEVAVKPNLWVPLSWASKVDDPVCISSRSCWWLVIMGRLKSGISEERAEALLKVASPQVLHDTVPPLMARDAQRKYMHWHFSLSPGAQGWTSLRLQFSHPLAILMTLVALVLLIACANMANLLLARAFARHREIAVRLSMGAGRARVIRQLLTESTLLSLLGGAVGILFAFGLTRLLIAFVSTRQQFGPNQFVQLELHPDWRIVLFTFTLAVGSGFLFGLSPAIRATRVGIAASLKESAHNLRGGNVRAGRLVILVQVALSVLLVAAAGLFSRTLFSLLTTNPGFNPKQVVVIGIDTDKRDKNSDLVGLYGRLLERVNALPGVQVASLMWFTPLTGAGWDDSPSIPGRSDLSEQQRDTFINPVGPRFFSVMETRILLGRQFALGDSAGSERVGILNELAARRFFPHGNAVGEHIVLGNTPIRIVGVATNTRYLSLRDPEPLELYIPYTQKADGSPSYTFVMKTGLGTEAILAAFRGALHELAPDVPIGLVKTMQEELDDSVGSERLMASLSIFFGVLALLLTCIGLYGILAYAVTRRTSEIGIRMALGARGHQVLWLVMRETIGYVAVGIAIGSVSVLGASRLVASLLYGIRPNDGGNLILATLTLAVIAAVSAFLPARRAIRLDPAMSLREE